MLLQLLVLFAGAAAAAATGAAVAYAAASFSADVSSKPDIPVLACFLILLQLIALRCTTGSSWCLFYLS